MSWRRQLYKTTFFHTVSVVPSRQNQSFFQWMLESLADWFILQHQAKNMTNFHIKTEFHTYTTAILKRSSMNKEVSYFYGTLMTMLNSWCLLYCLTSRNVMVFLCKLNCKFLVSNLLTSRLRMWTVFYLQMKRVNCC